MERNKKSLRKKILLFIFLILMSKVYSQIPANFYNNGCDWMTQYNPIEIHDKGYQLVFQDDFNGTSLNTADWQTYYPWGRSLANDWDGAGTGFEWEYYVDDNVTVNGGYLHLTTKVDPGVRDVNDHPDSWLPPNDQFFKYTSGMIYSIAPYKAGKVEISCRLPYVEGVWPAFWLYGPCAQEIDGFELRSHSQTSDPVVDSKNVIMSWHKEGLCGDKTTNCSSGQTYPTSSELWNEFHTYAIDWDETKIIWTIDGNIFRQVYRYWGWNTAAIYPLTTASEIESAVAPIEFKVFPTENNEMHIIINTAVSNDRGAYPKEFLIDYVKVYAKSECFTNQTVCENNIPAPGIIASKTITTNPSCNFTIAGGSQPIEMKAIDEITLNPGFSSEINSEFYAHLSDCENYEVRNPNSNYTTPAKGDPNNTSSAKPIAEEVNQNAPSNNSVNLFPNPTTGEFQISLLNDKKTITSIELVNLMGEKVLFSQAISDGLMTINITEAPKGIYFVKIFCGGTSYMKKVVYN
jgi:beta-glucanase (GH16 family)